MSANIETTPCCWGLFAENQYDQFEIEYLMDDYGGDVILVEEEKVGNSSTVSFPSSKRCTLVGGHYSVTMISKDSLISLLMVFKDTNQGRQLISGQMIKYGKVFPIINYEVSQYKDDDKIAYGTCVYGK
jgi:hypothetical protein